MKIAAADVVHLLHGAEHATLATQSLQMPGYPYATVVPCVLDETHCPILFISALAEHTKNVLAEARTSLSVVHSDAGNVQAAARLSIVGDCERFEPTPQLVARYLRYQPDAEQYLALDFMFFRLQPKRLRYIGGLGRMGWLEREDWHDIPRLALDDEAALLRNLSNEMPADTRLLGLDCYGLDYKASGKQLRGTFAAPALSADALIQAATQLVKALR
ncbi:MAG TPA: pyridoxamine 5'-phosphate oxidase family protein [Rhodocyclaceae bacterium]|nr:pyridoxamine 5'-phosphate oxidase family protein [Rhodocyclaceae bacterium]